MVRASAGLLLAIVLLRGGEQDVPPARAESTAAAIVSLANRLGDELEPDMEPSDRAMLVEEASEALVRIGRAPLALDLYRRAWQAASAAEDTRPELTARWRIATLCHQAVMQLRRQGQIEPGIDADMQVLLAPIMPARYGRSAFTDIRWAMIWADALGGRVAAAVAAVRDLDDQERTWWRLPDLLAAAWRAGYRDAVDAATRDLLREDRSQRQAFAYSRLRVGDLAGAQRTIGNQGIMEGWQWAASLAVDRALVGQHDEALRWAEGTNSDEWRATVMRQLVWDGRYAEADRYARGLKFDPEDAAFLTWTFIRGDPAVVVVAAADLRARKKHLSSLTTVVLGDWQHEPQRSAAIELRRLAGGWPCEGLDEKASAMAIAAIQGDWEAVARLRREASEWEDDRNDEVLRGAVIALADADRSTEAVALLQRCADAPCADHARALLAAAELRRNVHALPQVLLGGCTSGAGRRTAIRLMLGILANRWLGRPASRGLDWMDPRDGL